MPSTSCQVVRDLLRILEIHANTVYEGLINPSCNAFIGSGVVVHIPSLFNELDTLERKGTSPILNQTNKAEYPLRTVRRSSTIHLRPCAPSARVPSDCRWTQRD
jgi:hypothetical protein